MVPAQGGRRLTAAEQRQKEEAMELKALVAQRISQIEQVMPTHIGPWLEQAKISPEVFLSSYRLALAKNPKIARCTPTSLLLACMDSARVGLPPDGKKAAIVPYGTEATFVSMYQGIVDVMGRAGYHVTCQVVYEGEEEYLEYDLGDEPYIKFNPPIDRDDKKRIVGAYAIAVPRNGQGKWIEIMGSRELDKVAKVNKFGKVRDEWPGEMARKGPLRRLSKFVPTHPELEILNAIESKAFLRHARASEPERPVLSDDELLDDDATPALEGKSHHPADDADLSELTLINRYTEMLSTAPDGETLEARAELIMAEVDYETLEPTEKAVFDMVLRQQREAFDLDPETGEPVDAEPSATFTFVAPKSAKETVFQTPAEWQSEMMSTLSSHGSDALHFWWEANKPHIEGAIDTAPDHARRVLMLAVDKGFEGAGDMLESLK